MKETQLKLSGASPLYPRFSSKATSGVEPGWQQTKPRGRSWQGRVLRGTDPTAVGVLASTPVVGIVGRGSVTTAVRSGSWTFGKLSLLPRTALKHDCHHPLCQAHESEKRWVRLPHTACMHRFWLAFSFFLFCSFVVLVPF